MKYITPLGSTQTSTEPGDADRKHQHGDDGAPGVDPAGPQLVSQAKNVISAIEGVGNVDVKVVMIPPWTPDRMSEEAKLELNMI